MDLISVVVDARSVNPGLTGIGRYAENLLRSLDLLKTIEVTALVGREGRALLAGLKRVRIEDVGGGDALGADSAISNLLQRLDADIFHSPLFVLPAVRPCPCIATIHDVIPRARPELTSPEFAAFFERHAPRAIRFSAKVVTVSDYSAADIVRYFPEAQDKVSVVPEPVGPSFRPMAMAALDEALSKLDLRPGYVLFLGALDRRKGLDTLLDAWASLRGSVQVLPPLVVAGAAAGASFDLAGEIARRKLGNCVRALGRVPEPRLVALYGGASVFVFPSLYEGFGLPVLEAMACGVPVVAANSSSLPEVSGGAAVLVTPGAAGELAAAIAGLLRDPVAREDLVARGRERVKAFTLEAHAARLQALYESVAGRKR